MRNMPSVVQELVRAARAAPSADNCQPWTFQWTGEVLRVLHRDSGGFGSDEHATLMSLGAVIENMVQAGEALGVSVDWERSDEAGVHMVVHMPCADAVNMLSEGHPLFLRHTNRLPTSREPLGEDVVRRLEAVTEARASAEVLTSPAEIKLAGDAVETASAIRFRVREAHEILARSLRFTRQEVARGDGLDVATLGLPPGGALVLRCVRPWSRMRLLNSIGLYRVFARPEGQRVRQSSALVQILGPDNTWDDLIAAGRVLHRVWIRA